MKIYHKILLYQNKLLQPYVRILLRMMAVLTYMASFLLSVGLDNMIQKATFVKASENFV